MKFTIINNQTIKYHTLRFYTKKSYQKAPKIPMSNSIQVLQGSFDSVQQRYEMLSDIVNEYHGKVHGSQSQINGNNISLIVYYEIPEGKRDECKQRFNNFIQNSGLRITH